MWPRSIRVDKRLLEGLPIGAIDLQSKCMAQKVFRPCIFVQSPDQVSHRVQEVFSTASRRVQLSIVDDFAQRPALWVRHPFEHFELDRIESSGLHGHHHGQGDIE